jgi:hypothetical protein
MNIKIKYNEIYGKSKISVEAKSIDIFEDKATFNLNKTHS